MDSLFLFPHFLFLQLARDVGGGLLSSDVLKMNKMMDVIWASLESEGGGWQKLAISRTGWVMGRSQPWLDPVVEHGLRHPCRSLGLGFRDSIYRQF